MASQQETISTSLSQLTGASSYAQTQQALLQAQQSSLLSANTATVATSLQTAEVQHQAVDQRGLGVGSERPVQLSEVGRRRRRPELTSEADATRLAVIGGLAVSPER